MWLGWLFDNQFGWLEAELFVAGDVEVAVKDLTLAVAHPSLLIVLSCL